MIGNKRAKYDYFVIEEETAGIVLMGSEMKPLRNNHASISEAYIYIDKETNEVWIKGMYIKNEDNIAFSHEEYRDRKLLMTKKQIKKWSKRMEVEHLTIIPLSGFFNDKNLFKMRIFLAKGKKMYDKRNSIKRKDQEKQTKQELKEY
jgi:SsrA-binding protein